MSYLTIICGSKVYGITGVEVQEANDAITSLNISAAKPHFHPTESI